MLPQIVSIGRRLHRPRLRHTAIRRLNRYLTPANRASLLDIKIVRRLTRKSHLSPFRAPLRTLRVLTFRTRRMFTRVVTDNRPITIVRPRLQRQHQYIVIANNNTRQHLNARTRTSRNIVHLVIRDLRLTGRPTMRLNVNHTFFRMIVGGR